MDRFFYYTLGALAALMLTFGAIGYFKSKGVIDPAEKIATVGGAAPSPTPAAPFDSATGASPSPTSSQVEMPALIDMPAQSAMATPTPVPWAPPNFGTPVTIQYPGFAVVYSPALSSPLAVQYAMVGGAKPRRWPEVKKMRLPVTRLITDAGYARGEMAFKKSISMYFGKQAGANAELATNISAMTPAMAAGPWAQFGELEPKWAGEAGWIEVTAGPVFGNPAMQTANGVTVPQAFYRVYRRSYGDTMAFIIPQTATDPNLSKYLTSVSAVEAATGMSIFPNTIDLSQRDQPAKVVW